ncbi:hypothetical protein BH11MYX4_BH11MYX4_67680 [soil metagenome]
MKLRIRGNTLRLRLSRTEVDELAARGEVHDGITFGPAAGERLGYSLVTSDDATAASAHLSSKGITVTLRRALALDWASSDAVGLDAQQAIGTGEALKILVEKDFACLKPREGEDDADAFPNPEKSSTG